MTGLVVLHSTSVTSSVLVHDPTISEHGIYVVLQHAVEVSIKNICVFLIDASPRTRTPLDNQGFGGNVGLSTNNPLREPDHSDSKH